MTHDDDYYYYPLILLHCGPKTTPPFILAVTLSTLNQFDSNCVVSYRWSVDIFFLSAMVTEIFCCTVT